MFALIWSYGYPPEGLPSRKVFGVVTMVAGEEN